MVTEVWQAGFRKTERDQTPGRDGDVESWFTSEENVCANPALIVNMELQLNMT